MNDTRLRDSRALGNSRALARILDTAIAIPGTKIRVGLDAIIGLVPGAGDILSAALGSYIVMAAVRSGAPTPVIARMLGNVAIDTVVGSVPVLGDLFDIVFKSNRRNAELLERYAAEPAATTKRSTIAVGLAIAAVVLMLVGIITLGILAARAIWALLT